MKKIEKSVSGDSKKHQIQSFLLYLELERSLSPNSIHSYTFDLDKLRLFLDELNVHGFEAVEESHIEQFLAVLKKDLKAASTARMISALRKFYHHLID